MSEKEFFIDDRVVIPEDIKRMTKDELDKEITRLEAEAAKKKNTMIEKTKI